jgi:hypothetical protein
VFVKSVGREVAEKERRQNDWAKKVTANEAVISRKVVSPEFQISQVGLESSGRAP